MVSAAMRVWPRGVRQKRAPARLKRRGADIVENLVLFMLILGMGRLVACDGVI